MGAKESNLQVRRDPADVAIEEKQRRRMVIALLLLLLALIVVLIKDRRFWFSAGQPPEPVSAEQPAPAQPPVANLQTTPAPAVPPAVTTQTAPAPAVQPPVAPAAKAKSQKARGKKPEAQAQPATAQAPQAMPGPVITATNRTVLPPLEMEVVAGNQHRPLSPSNNSVKVDMESSASAAPPPSATPTVNQGNNVSVSADTTPQVTVPAATAERVTHSVKPDYPLLAKQMKVQGAVVLQALIDKAGRIQELHVVTGPAILASAAQEAVKQWRFKPYYQQGQAVETEARITVNFTISTY